MRLGLLINKSLIFLSPNIMNLQNKRMRSWSTKSYSNSNVDTVNKLFLIANSPFHFLCVVQMDHILFTIKRNILV